MKAVIVGASSGIGRCIGVGLAKRGADVALLARRKNNLVDAAAEAGGNAHAIVCDVTDESACKSAIEEAASALGGIDALVYAPAVGTLARIHETDQETWRRTLDTNVIGASLVTTAAIPYLTESAGVAAYLSSVSASLTPPWPGLGSYIVSKAALEKLVDAWRAEHPRVGFTRITVGDCAGGEGDAISQFANNWNHELAAELGPIWFAKGYLTGALVDVEEVINMVDTVVRAGASAVIPSVVVTPRPPG
jgi:NAD(P)-dependent dehydrogenase (short-subunit alcohol dehydrogenase family)